MLKIEPTGKTLGCTIHGLDLSKPPQGSVLREILFALGEHGVVRFPKQKLESQGVKALSECFGEVQVPLKAEDEKDCPGVGVLSNMVVDGKPLGKPDAGLMWHTEMSYSNVIGYVNVLYALKVPMRNGKPLGPTEFTNTRAAYEDLPADIKKRLEGVTAVHDVQNYWDAARSMGSTRPAFDAAHRAAKPVVIHDLVMTHPVTGNKFLYCNSGFTVKLNGFEPAEGDALLKFLIEHQLQPKYYYKHDWTELDVLIWDNLGTQHRAIPDYSADEHRFIKRCQVKSNKIFDPAFLAGVVHPERVAS
jgi:taurine dioxygenase